MLVVHLILQSVVRGLVQVSRVAQVAHGPDSHVARVQLGVQIAHVRNVEQAGAWVTWKDNNLRRKEGRKAEEKKEEAMCE